MSLLFDALKHAQQSNADNANNGKQQEPVVDPVDPVDPMDPLASQMANESVNEVINESIGTSTKTNAAGTQAAQAIFSATTHPKRNRLILLALTLLAIFISFAGTWFYLQAPESENDAVEAHTPPATTPPANISKQAAASTTTPNTNASKGTDKKTPAPIAKTNPNAKLNSASTSNTNSNDKNHANVTQKTNKANKTDKTENDASTTPTTPPSKPKTNATNTKPNSHTNNAPITLTASGNPDPLKDAYAALADGKLDESERKYLAVLVKRPHEKDALLGLAIIAHRKSQTSRALELYQQVLREDPENANATAGLLSLSAAADPVAAESHLKQALDLKQTSPELHYALGNLLARQKRWNEAQQAFFRAANLAPENTLYAYNLAVALDHLGKSSAAISSYEKVLKLIKPENSNNSTLNRNAIQQRVQELRKHLLNNPANSTSSP